MDNSWCRVCEELIAEEDEAEGYECPECGCGLEDPEGWVEDRLDTLMGDFQGIWDTGDLDFTALFELEGLELADHVECMVRSFDEDGNQRCVEALGWRPLPDLLRQGSLRWTGRDVFDKMAVFLKGGRSGYRSLTGGDRLAIAIVAREQIVHDQLAEFRFGFRGSAERARNIARIAFEEAPGTSALRFVQLLRDSYVAGHRAQCVILCRSLLEGALRDKFESTGIDWRGDLADAITLARERSWITADARAKATTARVRGNKALHQDPELTVKILETISDTFDVVRELTSQEPWRELEMVEEG